MLWPPVTEAATTLTVTGANQFELRFNAATGGGIDQFFDLAESSTRDAVHDLAGGTGTGKQHPVRLDLQIGGVFYNVDQDNSGARLDVLEATATRVRVRQESSYQQEGGTQILAGLKGFGDYSIYGVGKTAYVLDRAPRRAGVTYNILRPRPERAPADLRTPQ